MRRLDLIFKSLSIFGLIVLVFASCGTEPEFERDNENDPEAPNFELEQPQQGRATFDQQTGYVTLTWGDRTMGESRYKVYRSIFTDTSGFRLIATLDTNSEQFVDTAKIFTSEINYEVTAFNETQETQAVGYSIRFGSIGSLTSSIDRANKVVNLQWETETLIPSKVVVEHNYYGSDWTTIATLSEDENVFELDYEDIDAFSILARIKLYIVNNNGALELLTTSKSIKHEIYYPTGLSITRIKEDEFRATWYDNSDFESGFNLTHRYDGSSTEFIVEENDTTFSYIISAKNYPRDHSFTIEALNSDEISQSQSITERFIPSSPFQFDFSQLSINSLQLTWRYTSSENYIRGFYIERKASDESNFHVIAELDPSKRTFIDETINPNLTYTYKVRTKSSGYSNSIKVAYQKTLELDKLVRLDDRYYKFKYDSISQKIFYGNDWWFNAFDVTSSSNEIVQINRPGIREIALSPNGSLISIMTYNNDIGETVISLYRNEESYSLFSEITDIPELYEGMIFNHDGSKLLLYYYDSARESSYAHVYDVENSVYSEEVSLFEVCVENIIRHPEFNKFITDCGAKIRVYNLDTKTSELLFVGNTGNGSNDDFVYGNQYFFETTNVSINVIYLETGVHNEVLSTNDELFGYIAPYDLFVLTSGSELKIYNNNLKRQSIVANDGIDARVLRNIYYDQKSDRIIAGEREHIAYYKIIEAWSEF